MKIAIDIRNLGKKRTGDEVVFFNLVKNLNLIDRENEYFLLTDRNPRYDPELYKSITKLELAKNFKVVPLREKGTNRFLWNSWVLPAYLRKNPVDILQVQYITPFFVSHKVKILTIVHDISFNFLPQLIKPSDLFFLKTLIPWSLKRADKIIGVSQFTRNEIINYYRINPEKVEWIHNAVADNLLNRNFNPAELDSVRKKYHLPEKFILYLGTMQPRKNLPLLIEAYARLPEPITKNIKLVLAGGKGYNYDTRIDETIERFHLPAAVFFPGFIEEEDKPAVFRLAHVFCFPSLYEGFGIPILEAMTLGTPVIASQIPPHEEITEKAAVLFNPKRADELQKKLSEICTDENYRNDLIQKGKIQSQKFSWEKTAEKILNIYKGL